MLFSPYKVRKNQTDANTPVPAAEPAEPLPELILTELDLPKLPKERPVTEYPAVGILGLSDLDIIGYLQYLPGTNFRCLGPSPTQGLTKRTCRSSSDDNLPAVYEVMVLQGDPRTVLWVRAETRDVSDGAAAEFLGYVANLSLQDTDPINAEIWVEENVPSGGVLLAEGARLRLYGAEGARVLQIVATRLSSDIVPDRSDQSAPKSRDRVGQ